MTEGNDKRKEIGNIWLIIFSDITTNLMLFFLMLFAMTRMTAADRQTVVAGMESTVINKSAREQIELERQAKFAREEQAIKRLQQAVTEGRLAGKATIAVTDKFVKIALNPESFFSIGSAKLNPATISSLEALVELIETFPNDIVIEGHTDPTPVRGGAYRSNWELSIARAVSVVNFFTASGINPKQLVAAGYGEFHPAFPNDSEANRAKNRRIEISIVRQPRSTL
ncbi:MAG: flagellar motor protein MotB [Nitrospiraceae bacterium]|nr:flagellar motor protein MotB [Nitrospiraceae bacterium]